MAEQNQQDVKMDDNHQNESPQRNDEEEGLPTMCSICLIEPPINAVQLQCGHIFCYLCAKSAFETTGVCALCRTEIGLEFNFQEHDILGLARVPSSSNGYYWFYEGYRGWWLYDAETNCDIEAAYKRGERMVERFIAGYTYIINFNDMTQQRKDGEGRSRKVCRATLQLENILGIAGLKGKDCTELLDMMKCVEENQMLRPTTTHYQQ